jgi:hypothetical protein
VDCTASAPAHTAAATDGSGLRTLETNQRLEVLEHLGSNARHFLQLINRREVLVLLPPGHDTRSEDRSDSGQGIEISSGASIEADSGVDGATV